MKLRYLSIFLTCMALVPTNVVSQQFGRILGKVTDMDTGEPLPYANITVLETILGASTNEQGFYSIDRIPPGIYSLRFSTIGYDYDTVYSVTVKAGDVDTVDFRVYSCGTREAREDIANGRIRIRVIGLVIRTVPEDDENDLTDKFGFRNLYMGCVGTPCDFTYNQLMANYLDSLNGAGWQERLQAEFKSLNEKYHLQHRDE